jgi:SAM-dependent methyltransferase
MITTCLRNTDGRVLPLPGHRWSGRPSPADERLLERVDGPVLDVGCGPGRHVLALARAGVVALGIDISPPAIELARRQGAPVLRRSIFERVPGAGRWGTALLLDGNIGIGGCPTTLLRRVESLLRRRGVLLVELAVDGNADVEQVRFEAGGHVGPWFPWARVDLDGLEEHASRVGLRVAESWDDGDRRFARLSR